MFGDSLDDGDWTATLRCDRVADAQDNPLQDTDADPTDGSLLAATFHRLFGDADGDRDVDGADYSRFRAAYVLWVRNSQKTPDFDYFDFDQDGDVDADDFAAFRANYGSTLRN